MTLDIPSDISPTTDLDDLLNKIDINLPTELTDTLSKLYNGNTKHIKKRRESLRKQLLDETSPQDYHKTITSFLKNEEAFCHTEKRAEQKENAIKCVNDSIVEFNKKETRTQVVACILFGSFSRNTQSPESDIDLYFIIEKILNFQEWKDINNLKTAEHWFKWLDAYLSLINKKFKDLDVNINSYKMRNILREKINIPIHHFATLMNKKHTKFLNDGHDEYKGGEIVFAINEDIREDVQGILS